MKVAPEAIVVGLSKVLEHPEDYTDVIFFNGWPH